MRLTAAILALLVGAASCLAATLVVGGDFEGAFAPNGVAEGFVADSYSNWGDYDIVYSRDTANPHSGTACQKITVNRIGYISRERQSWIGHGAAQLRAAQPVPLRKGTIYRVRAWLRASEPIEVTVQIRQAGRPWWSYYDQRLMADETWRKVEYTFTSGVDDATACFIIKFAQLGTVWIDDAAVEELAPEEAARGVPPPEGNLLQNGSFDLGLANWMGAVDWDNTEAPVFEIEQGEEGPCLKMTPAGKAVGAVSDVVPLTPGWPVRATCRVRAARPVKVTFGVYTMGAQHAMWPFCATEAIVGPEWQKLDVSTDVPYMPFGPYGFIRVVVGEPVVAWLDDVQMRQDGKDAGGDPPRAAIITTRHPLNLYNEPEKPALRLLASVPADARATTFSWRVTDFWAKTVLSGTWKPGAGRHEKALPCPNLPRGWYRAEVSWKWHGRTLSNEATFCLLPPAERKGDPEKSAFGGHFMYGPVHLALAKAVGVRWVRTWPPLFTCWNVVEPEKGKLVWHDEAAQAYADRGKLRILGMLEHAPDWAAKEDDPKAAWAKYAETTVSHYKDRIRVWEVFNEPDLRYWVSKPNGPTRMEVYFDALTNLCAAVRRADPRATVVGGCLGMMAPGFDSGANFEELVRLGGLHHMDALSYHYYHGAGQFERPMDEGPVPVDEWVAWVREKMKAAGKVVPIINSEGGVYNPAPAIRYRPCTPDNVRALAPEYVAMLLARMYVAQMAAGVQRFFYYDMFISGVPFAKCWDSFVEGDGQPRPCVAAYATASWLLDGASHLRTERPSPNLWIRRFSTPRGPMAVLYTRTGTKAEASVPGALRAWDIMGREIALRGTAKLTVTAEPTYVLLKK